MSGQGVEAIFLVTNFWEHIVNGSSPKEAGQQESDQALTAIKIADKLPGLKHLIWSTLPGNAPGVSLSLSHAITPLFSSTDNARSKKSASKSTTSILRPSWTTPSAPLIPPSPPKLPSSILAGTAITSSTPPSSSPSPPPSPTAPTSGSTPHHRPQSSPQPATTPLTSASLPSRSSLSPPRPSVGTSAASWTSLPGRSYWSYGPRPPA